MAVLAPCPPLSTVAMLLSGYCSFPSGLCDGASGFSTSLYPGERAVDQFIAFWLHGGRRGRHERQRLGYESLRPGAGPLAVGVEVAAGWPIPAPRLARCPASLPLKADRRNDHGTQSQSATAS